METFVPTFRIGLGHIVRLITTIVCDRVMLFTALLGKDCTLGYIMKKEAYQDEQLGEVLRVDVTRPEIRYDLLTSDSINKVPLLKELFANRRKNLEKLNSREVNELNKALRMVGHNAPPDVSEDQDVYAEIGRLRTHEEAIVFVQNQPVRLEETRYVEFKALTSSKPADRIKNTADVYAVSFLNHSGGRILWGIRNEDRVVVGVSLTYQQRDDVRREVAKKLTEIQPSVPAKEFPLEFHPVVDGNSAEVPDLYVVDLTAPRGHASELYATGSGKAFMKTEGGKKELTYLEILAEHKRRLGLT